MKTRPRVDNVPPTENDMMLPLRVMKVMPTATQPMKDVVLSSENRLTAVKKPGVVRAATINPKMAKPRIRKRTRECGSRLLQGGCAPAVSLVPTALVASVMAPLPSGG